MKKETEGTIVIV